MASYIEKEKAIKAIVEHPSKIAVFTEKAIKAIESLSTADVVEVVRCKDCKHHGKFSCAMSDLKYPKNTDDNGFCHHGEKKGN